MRHNQTNEPRLTDTVFLAGLQVIGGGVGVARRGWIEWVFSQDLHTVENISIHAVAAVHPSIAITISPIVQAQQFPGQLIAHLLESSSVSRPSSSAQPKGRKKALWIDNYYASFSRHWHDKSVSVPLSSSTNSTWLRLMAVPRRFSASGEARLKI